MTTKDLLLCHSSWFRESERFEKVDDKHFPRGTLAVVPGMLGHVDLWGLNSEPANIPSLLAILLSDQVIVEEGTKKKTIVGVFDELAAAGEPITKQVGFFARMTDLEGQYVFAIKVVRIAAEDEIVVSEVNVRMPRPITNRLESVDIALTFQVLELPTFGKYEFQLFANDMYLGRALLNCRKLEVANQ